MSKTQRITLVAVIGLLSSCAIYTKNLLDERYGGSAPRERSVAINSEEGLFYSTRVKPIIEHRCVVCHSCYDAPCQLKMSSIEGIDRGASKAVVYSGTRLRAAPTSRLFIDQNSTSQWRNAGFHPVLNERGQSPDNNRQAGVMSRLLSLKQSHPAPMAAILPDTFDFSLDRDQQCATLDELDRYENKFPAWGMPYGLPKLSNAEYDTLQNWLSDGAKMALPAPISADHERQFSQWEQFLNGDSLKQQLVARYLYEHWFLAHLYFSDLPPGVFFRIVRSRTPPGEPIDRIATRRPYEDPEVDRVYYRLWRDVATIVAKTHMPYALNAERLNRYQALFFDPDYQVEQLPSYHPRVASNPFKTFHAIPGEARYRFLLEEAQFTIMNFIKGPVCRGQIALNVINDHFWVFFVAPENVQSEEQFAFYGKHADKLALPSAAASNALILTNWLKYSGLQRQYLSAKATLMNNAFPNGKHLTTEVVWDGDGTNQNATLTVFRHEDTASVVKGLVGQRPQTAWIIDYALLERIHYLLVAGFDVYGNIGHQLNSRLYMDFLRMEGEFNFLALLPPETRIAELEKWYRGVSRAQRKHILAPHKLFRQPSGIAYQTKQPKRELYELLRQRLSPALPDKHSLQQAAVPDSHRLELGKLQNLTGAPAALMAQVSILTLSGVDGARQYTLLHNNAHDNITSLLNEENHRVPDQDTLTVVNGLIGAYPGAFIRLEETKVAEFVESVLAMQTPNDYKTLLDEFGIRRTDLKFWEHSDTVNASYRSNQPYAGGLLDYSRLENR